MRRVFLLGVALASCLVCRPPGQTTTASSGSAGTIGFHAGFSVNRSWLYTTASYDYAGLVDRGNLQHADVGVGLCLPESAMFLPFAAPTIRAWWLRAEGPSDTTWSSGLRASGAIDVGARITPFVGFGKHSHSPILWGLTLRSSIPVVGVGGVITTAAFTLYGDML